MKCLLATNSDAAPLLLAFSFSCFAFQKEGKESESLLVACPSADHMHRTAAVSSAFVDFALASVPVGDASVSNVLEQGCALPDEVSVGTAVTLVFLDSGKGDPCSGHRVAGWEQDA